MASACVKNAGVTSPAGYSLYGRISLRREDKRRSSSHDQEEQSSDNKDQDPAVDFEFCPEDPVTMLSADELFSDGKLVPLKFSGPPEMRKPHQTSTVKTTTAAELNHSAEVRRRVEMEMSELFSPKAPRCTTRWRELLGLKKAAQESAKKTTSSSSSFKQFLHRGSKPSAASSSPEMASSRLSLSSSSSSSGHEIDDLPRLSLDLDNKPTPNPFAPSRNPRIRLANSMLRPSVDGSSSAADSPRLNASGKIVFHGLERSSSSPGCFTGGPRLQHHHGIPRSYSANVRITPVLNVPVSSLKSSIFFAHMFSSSSSPGNNKLHFRSNRKYQTNRTRL
ncbi:Uncharacterized protein Rs2_03571 [Raphanus sativus]|uniref:Uncharacterized protein LOC108854495 n=1 Tax=Raphanus sativus TaxID=3726 RepID=A0A6J0NGB6_RAPSA|nr:uncharacterized protein LOC108854495 [Raphanus sativus]KAJ4918021.1 Uncharacterized protein Rs2_03571 [Raphanus sativus]